MKVTMIGAGYVGLTTGACLADLGYQVRVYDVDKGRIADLRRSQLPIYEPGLDELVTRNVGRGRLSFHDTIDPAVQHVDMVFVTVGTPSLADGGVDLSHVETVARDIARSLAPDTVVVIKSTVEAGTARHITKLIATVRGDDDIKVAANPEFLREGSAIDDFFTADRIVCGADDERSASHLERLYEPLTRRRIPYVKTSTVDAELTKCAANAFLALKIGFINEVADLCESTGGDVLAIAEAIGLDRRIGREFLNAGPGFGGSCFPKDTRSFAATARRLGVAQRLIETLIEANESRKRSLATRILTHLGADSRGKTVAILGTAFKANTDDMREAAALTIVPILQAAGVHIRAHDPKAGDRARPLLPGIVWCDTPFEAAEMADALVVLTEWADYARLDLGRLAKSMRGRMVFDFRNLFDPKAVADAGLSYAGLGRGSPAVSVSGRSAMRGGTANRAEKAAAPV
ncbi:UDP-glucose/GDP-mannose dehydrogenase family protein [Ciceribacter sp. L1K23]|uniref:UDP-glucose dehydrogenase family protein n=1 Tax=Ciceribacter sp. L1K23 TaxID=2820276 RepID=UPI001B829866|nr:UDP-glucose/GDP-mannose dehydrogenase family protein [Ciceribacter sp. L1K23]MBR0557068.1 UDP-glucose/GDP-mannose dehydrogenase family protein [Ciceribacter sp. L1K23]